MKKLLAPCLIILLYLPTLASARPEIQCDGNMDNLNTYLAMHEILFMQRDTSRVREFYADEFISHNQDLGGSNRTVLKPDHMVRMWEESKKNSPYRVLTPDLILCAGDFVVVRLTMKGRRMGPLPNLTEEEKKNGRYYETSATDTYRFQDGKVVERWGNSDLLTIYRQLGLMPPADE